MVKLAGMEKAFPGFTLGPVDIEISPGSFFMLMGPTGAGKTLVLETVAGLCLPDRGDVFIKGKKVTSAKPGERDVGIVYQDSSLFPHMTVGENIEYGLKWNKPGSMSTAELAEILDLEKLMHRYPGKLSGGEKQRTALARALATGPSVVLLDEPMSSLDPQFRGNLRSELREIHISTGTTFIMATHDFSDALSLGTAGAVVNRGKIEQQGSIDEIFFKPENPFMASFVGMKNIIPVKYRNGAAFTEGGMRIVLKGKAREGRGHIAVSPDSIVVSIGDTRGITSERNRQTGIVKNITRDGYGFLIGIECSDAELFAAVTPASLELLKLREGMAVHISFKASAVHVF